MNSNQILTETLEDIDDFKGNMTFLFIIFLCHYVSQSHKLIYIYIERIYDDDDYAKNGILIQGKCSQ